MEITMLIMEEVVSLDNLPQILLVNLITMLMEAVVSLVEQVVTQAILLEAILEVICLEVLLTTLEVLLTTQEVLVCLAVIQAWEEATMQEVVSLVLLLVMECSEVEHLLILAVECFKVAITMLVVEVYLVVLPNLLHSPLLST